MAENSRAAEKLDEFKALTVEHRADEQTLRFGLDIFDIDPQPYPEINQVEKEIEDLREIWDIKKTWDQKWINFKEL
jgi:hypothetical protein